MSTSPFESNPAADQRQNAFSRWLGRRSFRSRITMLVVAAVGLSVALGALISYLAISHTITSNLDDDLKQKTATISHTFLADPDQLGQASASNALVVTGARVTIVLSTGAAVYPPPTPIIEGKSVQTLSLIHI